MSKPPPLPRTITDSSSRPHASTLPPLIAPSLVTGKLEMPTVVERAVATDGTLDARAIAERLAKELEAAQPADPAMAASFRYELGEVSEQRGHDVVAVRAYRRALELDPQLLPARWALHRMFWRRSQWIDLAQLIESESRAGADPATHADLVLERAMIPNAGPTLLPALDAAARAIPDHRGVLFELERQVAGKRATLADVLERLAATLEHPEHQIAYWLEAARTVAALDVERARIAIANAGRISRALAPERARVVSERVARERLRLAEEHGTTEEAIEAVAEVTGLLADPERAAQPAPPHQKVAHRRELVALHRRHAQLLGRTEPAFKLMQQALALAPSEPLLLVDLAELAHHLGNFDEMARLVRAWFASDDSAGHATMIRWWCAQAGRPGAADGQRSLHALISVIAAEVPHFLLLSAITEADAFLEVATRPAILANVYITAAQAARAGSWPGPAIPPRPEPRAAAALYVQAAELLGYPVFSPATVEQARAALIEALELAPNDPAVVEAMIELDDHYGRGPEALARLRDQAAVHNDRATIQRALRSAFRHDLVEDVLQLLRYLNMLEPEDGRLAWQLEAMLYQLGRDGERADLLAELARSDPDPARRYTALLGACRLRETSAPEVAIELYGELASAGDRFARDSQIDLLRQHERWSELVTARTAELATVTDPAAIRRARREIAWVSEIKLRDPARALAVYADWWAATPEDRTALEGVARCAAKVGDHVRETAARAAIAGVDGGAEATWLYARSLEAAGDLTAARQHYRDLVEVDDSIAATSAAAALGLLARSLPVTERADAVDAWAHRTTDPNLAGTLLEDAGWIHTVATADFERAAAGFAAAVEVDPQRLGAMCGTVLAVACLGERERLGTAIAELATNIGVPDLAAAMFLRASACASADGQSRRAYEHIKSARAVAPDNLTTLFIASEVGLKQQEDEDGDDPFAAVDELVARAEVYAQRAALTQNPSTRASWELDRAEALELAAQLAEASAIVGEVLTQNPNDRRAASMLRRIAYAAGDTLTWAYASYGLALLTRDPEHRLRLLRDVIPVFDQPKLQTSHAAHLLAAHRQLAETDPGAPEVDRLLQLLRDRNEVIDLIMALTSRLAWSQKTFPEDERSCFPLLFERATLLDQLGLHARAAADLDALLDRAPEHTDALLLRSGLATKLGDREQTIARLRRYLEIETATKRRGEIEHRLGQLIAEAENRPALTVATGLIVDDTTHTWQSEVTDPESLPGPPALDAPRQPIDVEVPRRRDRHDEPAESIEALVSLAQRQEAETGAVVLPPEAPSESERRPQTTGTHVVPRKTTPPPPPKPKPRAADRDKPDPFAHPTIVADPFGANTALADMSDLQEVERRAARVSTVPPVAAGTVATPQDTVSNQFKDAPMTIDDGTGVHEAPAPPPSPSPSGPAIQKPSRRTASRLTVPAIELVDLHTEPSDVTRKEPTLSLAVEFNIDPLDDDSAAVMLSFDQLKPAQVDASEEILVEYEREISLSTEPDAIFALRIEAGRLSEAAGEPERARAHYEAALLVRPKAPMGLRGLRRLACDEGDLLAAAQLIEEELTVAAESEREPLQQYRINLLLAIGEHDLSRVAVGELLDRTPDDVPGLIAYLQLALIDRRSDEVAVTLERLATAIPPELRRSILHARGLLSAHLGDARGAEAWWEAATAADPTALASRIEVATRDTSAAASALLELALHVEKDDPMMAAAVAVRAQSCRTLGAEERSLAAQLAIRGAPRDPLVTRFASESAIAAGDVAGAGHALARWARGKGNAAERAHAAALAADLDPARLGRLWSQALELDPDDDYASARLRAHLATDNLGAAVDVDLKVALDTDRPPRLLRAAADLVEEGFLDRAVAELQTGHERWPGEVAVTDALIATLAKARRWSECAAMLVELAAAPGPFAADVVRLHGALAATQAVRALDVRRTGDPAVQRADEEKAIVIALATWDQVLASFPDDPIAHAASLLLAERLGDTDLLAESIRRLRAVEPLPWAKASLALREARLVLTRDPRLAQELACDALAHVEDPRCTLMVAVAAAHRGEYAESATALADRAIRLDAVPEAGLEPVMLRARAARLALDAGDTARARGLLATVAAKLPGLVEEQLDVASGHTEPASGARPEPVLARSSFARVIRDAEHAEARGAFKRALQLYEHALERWFADPIAATPMYRLAVEHGEAALLRTIALERLRTANAREDELARADAFELLARVDPETSHIALERALQSDPTRLDVLVRLEREHGAHGRFRELLRTRTRRFETLHEGSTARDLVALHLDTASIATRAGTPTSDEAADAYRSALALDPACRVAMFHLDMILRAAPADLARARLHEHVAEQFEDPRVRAAALTRAGETYLAIGNVGEAIARFARATDLVPSYAAALDAWYHAALSNQLWPELADVITRKAALAPNPEAAATYHHFAGVALMDKARSPEAATVALSRTLEARPSHLDALLRLRTLLGPTVARASALEARLAAETDRSAQIELNRMLAEHYREVGDRDAAVRHYRAMLSIDPADARAHAAIADTASDWNSWREAADAVRARLVLERDVVVLHALNVRLGDLAAKHDAALALEALQRALTFQPDDNTTRARVADLAIAAADWQVALEACDQLVKTERDPDKLAAHLHRAATVFHGLGDDARADRMLALALDSTPTNTETLRRLVELHAGDDGAALRAHLDRIVERMRARVAADPRDRAGYRMLAEALSARGTPDDRVFARCAAELAQLLGDEAAPAATYDTPARSDDRLFAPETEPIRAVFRTAAEAIAKHVGLDASAYGVGRKDRLRSNDPVAAVVQEIAAQLGIEGVDTYISSSHASAAVAFPGHPVTLVLGASVAARPISVRFGAGAALTLAQQALAVPALLRAEELGVLGLAVLKLVQPEHAIEGIDDDAATKQAAKLRRLVSSRALAELRPLATAITTFDPNLLARDLKIGGLRAGFAMSGSVLPGLSMVAAAVGVDVPDALDNSIALGLVGFGLGNSDTGKL